MRLLGEPNIQAVQTKQRQAIKTALTSGALVAAVLLAGCGKAPEPLAQQAARATPESTVTEVAGSSLPTASITATQFPTPGPAPTSVPQFHDPETQAAVEAYQNSWRRFQQDARDGANMGDLDPLTNPGAITGYANKIGADANQLDAAERAARQTMNPEERKRFKAFQKDLQSPED